MGAFTQTYGLRFVGFCGCGVLQILNPKLCYHGDEGILSRIGVRVLGF